MGIYIYYMNSHGRNMNKFNGLMKTRNSGNSRKSNTSPNISNILFKTISILIIVVLLLLAANIIYYYTSDCYQKKNLIDYMTSMSLDTCTIKESKTNSLPYIERKLENDKEVFHIGNQDFTYKQAKCKCASYGARLATKSEVIETYNKGGDWCSYGWSEGQSAYYPTQKCTWDKLQRQGKNNKYSCGMPGVNGGFFSNPKLKFGVNCYGVKPKGKAVVQKKPKCKKKDFCERERNYNASHKLGTDDIIPFNHKKWSMF